jgi:hypothetical protein
MSVRFPDRPSDETSPPEARSREAAFAATEPGTQQEARHGAPPETQTEAQREARHGAPPETQTGTQQEARHGAPPETQTEAQPGMQHATPSDAGIGGASRGVQRGRPGDIEPRSIPGLRAMAAVRWLILFGSAALALGTWWNFVAREPFAVRGETRFYCPMHPQITSSGPGHCPICFMRLEPIPDPRATGARAWTDAGSPEPEPALVPVMLTTERRQLAGIASVPVRRRAIGDALRLPATVEAREGARYEVRVRVPAFVEHAPVRETGVRVRGGQPLVEVYAPEIVQAQEELLLAARWTANGTDAPGPEGAGLVERARERLERLGVAPRDIDAIVATGRISRTVPIRAPASGWVIERTAVVGAYAQPDAPLFVIADLTRVWVVASAFPEELASLAPGMEARFVPSEGGSPIPITLDRIVPTLESAARTASVRFVAANPGLRLLPGGIGEVEIELPPREHLVVPRDAVIDTGLARYVFVEREGGWFEPRPVEIGPLFGDERAIASGLAEGERVVARGAFVLDSESRLQSALAPRALTDGGVGAEPASGASRAPGPVPMEEAP